MKNRIVVIGAGGMLGVAVSRYFGRTSAVKALRRAEFDIAKDPLTKLHDLIEADDVVINCAGVIKPQIASTPIEDVLKVNAIFPYNLARVVAAKRARAI